MGLDALTPDVINNTIFSGLLMASFLSNVQERQRTKQEREREVCTSIFALCAPWNSMPLCKGILVCRLQVSKFPEQNTVFRPLRGTVSVHVGSWMLQCWTHPFFCCLLAAAGQEGEKGEVETGEQPASSWQV